MSKSEVIGFGDIPSHWYYDQKRYPERLDLVACDPDNGYLAFFLRDHHLRRKESYFEYLFDDEGRQTDYFSSNPQATYVGVNVNNPSFVRYSFHLNKRRAIHLGRVGTIRSGGSPYLHVDYILVQKDEMGRTLDSALFAEFSYHQGERLDMINLPKAFAISEDKKLEVPLAVYLQRQLRWRLLQRWIRQGDKFSLGSDYSYGFIHNHQGSSMTSYEVRRQIRQRVTETDFSIENGVVKLRQTRGVSTGLARVCTAPLYLDRVTVLDIFRPASLPTGGINGAGVFEIPWKKAPKIVKVSAEVIQPSLDG